MTRQLYYFISTFFIAGSMFIINYILSQKLSLQDYGLFGLLTPILSNILPFILLGQATAMTSIFFSAEKKASKDIHHELIKSIKIMGAGILLVFVIVTAAYSLNFFEKRITYGLILLVFLASITEAFRTYFLSIINCFDYYKIYFLTVFLYGITALALVYFNPTVFGYFISLAITGLCLAVSLSTLIFKRNKKLLTPDSYSFGYRELLSLGWIAVPGMFISSLSTYLDRYLFNYFFLPSQVGVYVLASTIAVGVGGVFINALLRGQTILIMKNLQDENYVDYHKSVLNIQKVLIGLMFAGGTVFHFIGEWLVLHVFGQKFLAATPYILPLFFIVVFNGMTQFLGSIFIQKKKMTELLVISAIVLCINIGLMSLGIYFFQVKGIFIGSLASAIMNMVVTIKFSQKYLKENKVPIVFIALTVLFFYLSIR